MLRSLVGSEMCIRDRSPGGTLDPERFNFNMRGGRGASAMDAYESLDPMTHISGPVRNAYSPAISYDPRVDGPVTERRRIHNPHLAGQDMPGHDAPTAQEVIMESSDESQRNTPMEATRVPSGGSSVPADTSVGRMRMMEREMDSGIPTHFLTTAIQEGLSTPEILQRARRLGISQDAVLRELTKPQYRPQQP